MTVVDQAEMLEVLLSYCATWQALARAATTPADAALFIHQYECDEENECYPRATIIDGEATSQGVSISQFAGTGTLFIEIDLVPDVTLETRKARRAWVRDKIHTIKAEMEALSYGRTTPSGYSVSHLIVKSIRVGAPTEQGQIDRPIGEDKPQFVWTTQLAVEYGN